jgi:hypothetical protein
MRRLIGMFAVLNAASLFLVVPGWADHQKTCAADSVKVGPLCVDRFEASVWSVSDPAKVHRLRTLAQSGKATLHKLNALGATQHGVTGDDYPCSKNANDCKDVIFAFSIPGVKPSAFITWFQAQQAAANSGKRLLSNAEWQMAAAGTPDAGTDDGSTDCNISFGGPVNTGSRDNCKSAWGAFDMVGNVSEWVADWVPRSTACGSWGSFADDFQCLAGAAREGEPGALLRGGGALGGSIAGVFAVFGLAGPSAVETAGFRCGR